MKKIIVAIVFTISLINFHFASAHPMPNSLVLLNIQEEKVEIELQLPVQEFELAYGKNLRNIDDKFIETNRTQLMKYILAHTKIYSNPKAYWQISVSNIKLDSTESELNGVHKELIYEITCSPQNKKDIRKFTLQYDAIIHQVVTHFAIIKINQDFNNRIIFSEPSEIGIIQLDIASNTVKPFTVNLDDGSRWNGFKKMVDLGMNHIKTGIDHLLFLLVTLLVAPIVSNKKSWQNYGGHKYFIKRGLKIVTAFTIGHSLTLLIICFFNIPNYAGIIEVAIAFTILLSAINAIKPIFANKEVVITFFFGLIHGSAFASSLFNLNLNTSLKLLSVCGFNFGIELMQIVIVIFFIPFLLLSKFKFYKYVRITGAIFSIIASLGWIIERVSSHGNAISTFMNHLVS
jgi:hypothetical protein